MMKKSINALCLLLAFILLLSVGMTANAADLEVIAYDSEKDAVCPKGETCPISAFTDLDPTAWYHDGIHFCLANGMMNGTGNGRFAPGGTANRAMLVTILYRLEGAPEVTAESPFDDVAAGKWYSNAVIWAAENKLVTGYGNGKFGPMDNVTREQLAAILYRYAQSKGQGFQGAWTFPLDYPDASEIASWADEAMHWMVTNEIIRGKDGSLVPKGDTSRAEAATMLMRYCGSAAEAEGIAWYYGKQTGTADFDKAEAAFRTAADAGVADAWYYLGRIAYQRNDLEAAVAFFETGAEQGSEFARLNLGILYENQDYVVDYEKARELFQEAVDHGCIEANCGFGDLYQNGGGVEADGARALEYFFLATETNDPEWAAYACVSIYEVYISGVPGVEPDSEQLAAWQAKVLESETALAEIGHPYPRFLLGYFYYVGRNVEQDYAEAMTWFLRASEVGNARAMYYLGRMYNRAQGVEEDQTESSKWFLRSAEGGYVESMYLIGRRYELGNGIEQDLEKAIAWYQKAADAGHVNAGKRLTELLGN